MIHPRMSKSVSVMVYFLVYYKSMLIFEREMDHSLEDLPEHGLEVLHDLSVHQAAPLLDDGLRHVVSLQEAGVSLKSNCLLIESVNKGKFSALLSIPVWMRRQNLRMRVRPRWRRHTGRRISIPESPSSCP